MCTSAWDALIEAESAWDAHMEYESEWDALASMEGQIVYGIHWRR